MDGKTRREEGGRSGAALCAVPGGSDAAAVAGANKQVAAPEHHKPEQPAQPAAAGRSRPQLGNLPGSYGQMTNCVCVYVCVC